MRPYRVMRHILLRFGFRLPVWLMNKDLRAMQRMACLHSKQNVVIDLGAHVGYASIAFSHAVKEVHAFEPNPLNFQALHANLRHYPNIVTYEKAIL